MNEPEPDLSAIAEERAAAALILGPAKWVEPKTKRRRVEGTHMGALSPEARKTRAAKNARNKSRRGQATRPRGSQSKGRSDGSRRTSR